MLHRCLFSLGSNYQAVHSLAFARKELAEHFTSLHFSSAETTAPIGMNEGKPFLNQVALGQTEKDVPSIITLLKDIEHRAGRQPEEKALGKVRLDIDLLRYDNDMLRPDDFARSYVQTGLKELLKG
jgi:2-amino-4-hydroxy-6-hydroxymethyldihydropteridine diphosphokinase